jgi:hypothetical protein
MQTDIRGELATSVDTIAVSEKAKQQIGLQASAHSSDAKWGPNFLDTFSEFSEVPG